MIRNLWKEERSNECEHRSVSKDGRIICAKIVDGDNAVSPDVCAACPVRSVNCTHLRFGLQQTAPSPLIVRYNGRTEVWDNDPPEVRFQQAACSTMIMPIEHPRVCAGCTLRQALNGATAPSQPSRRAAGSGRVAALPDSSALSAGG